MAESSVFNCDCIEYMRSLPDNFFDLAVADPPYGSANSDALLGGGDSSEQDSKDTFNQPIQRWNLGEQIQVTANKAHGGRFARYEKFGGGWKRPSGILLHHKNTSTSYLELRRIR